MIIITIEKGNYSHNKELLGRIVIENVGRKNSEEYLYKWHFEEGKVLEKKPSHTNGFMNHDRGRGIWNLLFKVFTWLQVE